jgi:hypothetical protein
MKRQRDRERGREAERGRKKEGGREREEERRSGRGGHSRERETLACPLK